MISAKIYILTIMLCAVGQTQCVMPQGISEHLTHYDCVKSGMGDGYAVLFGSDLTKKQVNDGKLYVKFSCIEKEIVES
tara:strand:+ start:44 stop:277 length:234 start_codon:yes stop_codon:yes gene_type:complete